MKHVKDIAYRGHEIVIMEQSTGKYAVDIRSDDYDGEFIAGFIDLELSEVESYATNWVDKYILDQLNAQV